ncbi:hypothetical protein E2C06_24345 [Dankookia rubra]|uniref:Uncharacterized protein n=1 Tax=Dankookia rubra TaxID=1442381 RepID=A0A4R5QBN1_9PROT|nr:hypothetical protein [Dankookia rubra]TDH60008.1 hypothetical protein E2C06_24345 [Dankookia rubra]
MPDFNYPSSAIADIEVAAHTLLLPQGTYCLHVTEVAEDLEAERLPGLSVAVAPGEEGGAIEVARLSGEPWLRRPGDALLVRVHAARIRLLLTSYNLARAAGATPPKIQVQRLDAPAAAAPALPEAAPPALVPTALLVHARRRGDLSGGYGDWVGEQADDVWIEGFAITPPAGLAAADLEYQAVLGKGWFSPWSPGGEFCGSRGMQLPILGWRINLKGDAAKNFTCNYSAVFVDGSEVGPVTVGQPCMLPDLKAVAKLRVSIVPRTAGPVDVATSLAAPGTGTATRSKGGTVPRSGGGRVR